MRDTRQKGGSERRGMKPKKLHDAVHRSREKHATRRGKSKNRKETPPKSRSQMKEGHAKRRTRATRKGKSKIRKRNTQSHTKMPFAQGKRKNRKGIPQEEVVYKGRTQTKQDKKRERE